MKLLKNLEFLALMHMQVFLKDSMFKQQLRQLHLKNLAQEEEKLKLVKPVQENQDFFIEKEKERKKQG